MIPITAVTVVLQSSSQNPEVNMIEMLWWGLVWMIPAKLNAIYYWQKRFYKLWLIGCVQSVLCELFPQKTEEQPRNLKVCSELLHVNTAVTSVENNNDEKWNVSSA